MNTSMKQQSGVVLLVSLVLLLLLTIIAITAASTATLQQRMANNAQESNKAFQAAETGLSRWLTLFEAKSTIPTGNQPTGSDTTASYNLNVSTQANCLAGSLNVAGGFEFTCHHITSEGATDTNARSRHRMGFLVRQGL